MSSEGTETSSRTADLQLYSHSQLKKRPAHVPHGRARSTRQAARPPEFARRAPTGSQQGTGSYVRTYGITARIPSLEVDPPAIGSYGPQKHTFSRFTPFPKFPEKTLAIDYSARWAGDCQYFDTIPFKWIIDSQWFFGNRKRCRIEKGVFLRAVATYSRRIHF